MIDDKDLGTIQYEHIYSDVGYFVRGRPGFRSDPAPPRMDWQQTAINLTVWVIFPGLFWWTVIRALLPTIR